MTCRMAVCDDNDADIRYVCRMVSEWAAASGHIVRIDRFPSSEAFLFRYAEDKSYDILLLDIEMDGLNGVELAKQIRAENETVQVIFVTGYPDYIAEGYEVSALHYLMKPVQKDKLSSVLDRAVKNRGKTERSVIFTAGGETIRRPVGEIVCVEAFAHVCQVTLSGGCLDVRQSISDVEALLGEGFVRCHRSYIVGLKYIRSLSRNEVILDGGRTIPLSRRHYDDVHQAFIRYFKGE